MQPLLPPHHCQMSPNAQEAAEAEAPPPPLPPVGQRQGQKPLGSGCLRLATQAVPLLLLKLQRQLLLGARRPVLQDAG